MRKFCLLLVDDCGGGRSWSGQGSIGPRSCPPLLLRFCLFFFFLVHLFKRLDRAYTRGQKLGGTDLSRSFFLSSPSPLSSCYSSSSPSHSCQVFWPFALRPVQLLMYDDVPYSIAKCPAAWICPQQVPYLRYCFYRELGWSTQDSTIRSVNRCVTGLHFRRCLVYVHCVRCVKRMRSMLGSDQLSVLGARLWHCLVRSIVHHQAFIPLASQSKHDTFLYCTSPSSRTPTPRRVLEGARKGISPPCLTCSLSFFLSCLLAFFTVSQCHEITRSQDCKVTRSQDHKIAGLPGRKGIDAAGTDSSVDGR